MTTELTWPAIRVVAGKDRVGADILYLTGPEPDFRWPTFIDAVVGLVQGPRGPHRRRARGLPGPDPPHPPGAAGLDRPAPVGGAGRTGGHRARDPRGPGRRAGRARGGPGPGRGAGDRTVGPGAPLRVGHALPRGQRRAHRGALRGDRHRARQLVTARRRPRRPAARWTSSSGPTPSTSRWSAGWRRPSTPRRSSPRRPRRGRAQRGRDRRRAGAVPQRRRALTGRVTPVAVAASSCGFGTAARRRAPGPPGTPGPPPPAPPATPTMISRRRCPSPAAVRRGRLDRRSVTGGARADGPAG